MVLFNSVLLMLSSSLVLSSSSVKEPYKAGDPWNTLTPDAPIPTNALTNFTSSFAIAPIPITDSSLLSSISSKASVDATRTETTTTISSSSDSASSESPSTSIDPQSYFKQHSKKTPGALELTLNDTALIDSKGRIGSIVANRQFQFDGPPPQAGAIYAAGWSITKEGNLAIGDNDVFYQCLSGTFYNLYDESLGEHCTAINLAVIGLIE